MQEKTTSVCLTREEISWVKRLCQRAIQLCDKVQTEKNILDLNLSEDKEKAAALIAKMETAFRAETYETVDDLLNALELIRQRGVGTLSMPKAIYLIVNELRQIRKQINDMVETR